VSRTLVDLAAVLPFDDLARACHEAGVLHATTLSQVARGDAFRRYTYADVHEHPGLMPAELRGLLLHAEGPRRV